MHFAPPSTLSVLLVLLAGCGASAPDGGDRPSRTPAAATPPGAASLTAPRDVPAAVRQLASRSPDNLEVSQGPTPGSRVVRIRSGFAEVLVSRANPDGTHATRCLDSAGDAAAFLAETGSTAPADR